MEEIADGLWHWTAIHPNHGGEVSSYYLAPERVLLDPLLPDEDPALLDGRPAPEHVVLTNRHHWRSCSTLIDAFGVEVHVNEKGLRDLLDADRAATPFAFGATLPGGLVAHEVGVLCPEETWVEVPRLAAAALADAVTRDADGLGFFPDGLLGDDPAAVRTGIAERLDALARELHPKLLLLAHGAPFVGDAEEQLTSIGVD